DHYRRIAYAILIVDHDTGFILIAITTFRCIADASFCLIIAYRAIHRVLTTADTGNWSTQHRRIHTNRHRAIHRCRYMNCIRWRKYGNDHYRRIANAILIADHDTGLILADITTIRGIADAGLCLIIAYRAIQ